MFSEVQGRLQVARGGVELRPRSFLELRGSSELQNGGLRALEEAWIITSRSRHFSRPSFTGRVLRLLAETSGDRCQMRPRTDDDVSRDSARLRVTPRRWLQTRRLETRSSFSDRVRRELSNGGSVALFWSRNEKINIFGIIGDISSFLCSFGFDS